METSKSAISVASTRPATQQSTGAMTRSASVSGMGGARGAVSGTRSTCGAQTLSHKTSAPSFSFGSGPSRLTFSGAAARGPQILQASVSSGGAVSPGPVYNPCPTSKWLGDAATPKFGTQEQRPSTGAGSGDVSKITGKSNLPGPGNYPLPPSVGKQPLGRCHSLSAYSFGNAKQREPAAKVTASPGPVYEPRGMRNGSMVRSAYSFGNEIRGKEKESSLRTPGPGNYNTKPALGIQVDSDMRSGMVIGFGTPGRGEGGRGILPLEGRASPGPIYMNAASLKRQALSDKRTAHVTAFTRADRFKTSELAGPPGPGPGEYIVRLPRRPAPIALASLASSPTHPRHACSHSPPLTLLRSLRAFAGVRPFALGRRGGVASATVRDTIRGTLRTCAPRAAGRPFGAALEAASCLRPVAPS